MTAGSRSAPWVARSLRYDVASIFVTGNGVPAESRGAFVARLDVSRPMHVMHGDAKEDGGAGIWCLPPSRSHLLQHLACRQSSDCPDITE